MLHRTDRSIVIYKMSSFCRMTPLNLQNENSLQNATKEDEFNRDGNQSLFSFKYAQGHKCYTARTVRLSFTRCLRFAE